MRTQNAVHEKIHWSERASYDKCGHVLEYNAPLIWTSTRFLQISPCFNTFNLLHHTKVVENGATISEEVLKWR